jgi:acyl transferase domain-containing protein
VQTVLGIKPQACIGYCSGESNALIAMNVWRDVDALFNDIAAAKIYSDTLVGDYSVLPRSWLVENEQQKWITCRVFADINIVADIVKQIPFLRLTIINSPIDCVVAGHPQSCQQLFAALNQPLRTLPYSMIIHCPEFLPAKDIWYRIHHRKTFAVKNIDFYSSATGQVYVPTQDSSATALTAQASDTVNFPQVILNAWQNGVRKFIEMGPRDLCCRWISEILQGKPHQVISVDKLFTSFTTMDLNAKELCRLD